MFIVPKSIDTFLIESNLAHCFSSDKELAISEEAIDSALIIPKRTEGKKLRIVFLILGKTLSKSDLNLLVISD